MCQSSYVHITRDLILYRLSAFACAKSCNGEVGSIGWDDHIPRDSVA